MNQTTWDILVLNTPGLVTYYKCDEASGLPQDSSGFNCHTTVDNGAGKTYQQAGPFTGALAITFPTSGTDNTFSGPVYTPVPFLDTNYSAHLTLECWLRVDSVGGDNGLIWEWGNISMLLDSTRLLQGIRQGVAFCANGTTALNTGQWYYLVLDRNIDDVWDYWIDGVLDLSTSCGAIPVPALNGAVFGPRTGGGALHGLTLSNVAYYQAPFDVPTRFNFPDQQSVLAFQGAGP